MENLTKLFRVLVIGGALLAGAGCGSDGNGSNNSNSTNQTGNTDGGVTATADGGSGVCSWLGG
jgi:hypothetical protein